VYECPNLREDGTTPIVEFGKALVNQL